MKKQVKKLVLAKETVRLLETWDLTQIAAGITGQITCNNLSACNRTYCC